MPLGAVLWAIRITTGSLGSRMYQTFFMREYRKKCFSLCPSMDILHKARLIFTKDSKLMANKELKATR